MKQKLLYTWLFIAFSWGSLSLKAQSPNGILTPSTNDTVCAGTSGFMTLSGFSPSSLAPSFWQVSTNGGSSWTPISNALLTNTYFMVQNNLCYRVILNNGDTSGISCLIVDQPSDAGTVSGGGVYCGTAAGSLTSTGSNGNILGWYQQVGANYNSLSNTSSTYNFSGINATTNYAFLTQNGVCPADTAFASVSVDAISNAGILLGSDTVCASGNSGSIAVSGVTGNILGWASANSASGPWTSLGTTAGSYTYSNLTQDAYYYLVVKNGVCPPDTSNQVLIHVDQVPVAGSLSGGGYFCGAPASGTLTLSGYSGTIVQWQSAANSSGPWASTSCTGTSCIYSGIFNPQTFYRVEIDNSVCPSVFTALDTVIYSAASVSGTLDSDLDSVCSGKEAPVLTLSGYTGNTFQWQMSTDGGASWINLPYTTAVANLGPLYDTSLFRVIVKNNSCASVTSNTVSVLVHASPSVSIQTSDASIMIGSSLPITANGTGAPSWNPSATLSSSTTFSTTATPLVTTSYTLTVDGGFGCIEKDSIRIIVMPLEFTGFISNTLTPNGDGINDAFYVENIEAFKSSELLIFNEYGQEVYRSAPYMNDWKGTWNNARLPDGTYFYVLKFRDTNSIYKGNITLISQK
ncbi:MAG: gliding motility-associated C-terminal domain-containing protein [Bacteroidia bacterium]